MTARSCRTGKRLWHSLLITLSGLLMSLSASAATSGSISSTVKPADGERRVAAYHEPDVSPLARSPGLTDEVPLENRFAKTRRMLIDLRAFLEDASTIADLDRRLKVGRRENDRLRQSLLSHQAARDAFESQMRPTETIVTALTRTVVRNWLETVRVKRHLEETGQKLSASKASWSDLERRVAKLRAALSARRAELHSLRTERTALSVELGRLRREVSATKAEARRFERERDKISDVSRTLRQSVASDLRQILLESGLY